MTHSTDIRPVRREDLPLLSRVIDSTGLFPSEMLDDMISDYLEGPADQIWFTETRDDVPISFGYCEPERMTEGTWNLLAIGVLPDCQGQGTGSRMIAYLQRNLAAKGVRVLLVETMGTPEFERTRRFYRKCGFIEEARIREFYAAGADKIVFWKHL